MNKSNKSDSIGLLFQQALNKKLESDLSKHHKNNLRYAFNHFMEFIGAEGRKMSIRELTTSRIEEFLQLFGSSATYYMNRRRELNILFNLASRMIDEDLLAAKEQNPGESKQHSIWLTKKNS